MKCAVKEGGSDSDLHIDRRRAAAWRIDVRRPARRRRRVDRPPGADQGGRTSRGDRAGDRDPLPGGNAGDRSLETALPTERRTLHEAGGTREDGYLGTHNPRDPGATA